MPSLALYGGESVRRTPLVFQKPELGNNEIAEVVDTLRSGWLSSGPKVEMFLEEFLSFKRAAWGVPLNSCSSALFLALRCADIQTGDEVITTPLTFGATANAIEHTGARTVFADCDPHTLTISPDAIEKAITKKTKALIVVHFAGRPCAMDEIEALCKKRNLWLIEDCAHACEAEYKGKPVGTIGDFGCFSFYATKNVCAGEGGILLTKRKKHAAYAEMLANQGMKRNAWRRFQDKGRAHYKIIDAGYKMNMMDLQAAIALHQLRAVMQQWQLRRDIWDFYTRSLRTVPCQVPCGSEKGIRHAFHFYPVLIDQKRVSASRDLFMRAMVAENIGVGVHYIPLHEHPYYRTKYRLRPHDYPVAHTLGMNSLTLNVHPHLTTHDQQDVIAAFKKVSEYFKR